MEWFNTLFGGPAMASTAAMSLPDSSNVFVGPQLPQDFTGPLPPGGFVPPPQPSAPPGPMTDASASSPPAAQAGGPFDQLVRGLRGVQAPKPPDVVKPSTPNLVPPKPIQQGALFDLLAAMGAYGMKPGMQNVQKYPATLGQAMR